MRDAVKSTLIALPRVQPVRPVFDDERKRLTYLQWLGDMSARLKRLNADSATRSELLETVWYESVRAGLEPALVLGLIEVVSHFRKYEISPTEARGYMQVATRWSRTIGDGDTARLFHMQTNLRFGCVILRHYVDTANGDIFAALIRYYGQSLGKSVRLTDPAGVAFVNSVLAARQHWVKIE